jgi:signal transduction histidine kinase
MNNNNRYIIERLTEVVRTPKSGRPIHVDFLSIPKSDSQALNDLRDELELFTNQFNDNYQFVIDLSNGKLDTVPPTKNSFADVFKNLQAELRHMAWQIQQISQGDLNQVVSFSGDLSHSMNSMIESLREKDRISAQNAVYVEELKELNATKDKFFSIISHDLKNPFSGLIGISDILISDIQNKQYENLEEYAMLVKESSTQGYKLLTNLLEWARLQTNTISVKIAPISLEAVVDQAKTTIQPKALHKKIQIQCQCERNYMVMADDNMLNTVMRNLLSNAIKFTPEGGSITISGKTEEDRIILSVKDTGVGIREQDIPKLFRIDTNFSTKGTNRESGTGLGLILCKEFIEKMNGEIWLKSEVGKGTEFFISLPLA